MNKFSKLLVITPNDMKNVISFALSKEGKKVICVGIDVDENTMKDVAIIEESDKAKGKVEVESILEKIGNVIGARIEKYEGMVEVDTPMMSQGYAFVIL